MYPEPGFTKGQVIDYYVRVAPFMLPHLKNHPLTLKRYPDGIHGQHFYEKDAPSHTPPWVKIAPMPRRGGGDDIRFILINDLPSLVWAANLASLEMHILLAKAPRLNKPTSIVFDLDPGEPATILDCCVVASKIREVLKNLGLQSFVKTSGSKGLQLYIPLNTAVTYEQTQPFAKSLAELMERNHPDLVVSSMAKELRRGKVFIDWSQNSDFKTTVCVYSLRAKKEQPFVSLPFTWEEMTKACRKENPESLYLDADKALHRLEKIGDVFAPVLELKQKLPRDFAKALTATAPSPTPRKKVLKGLGDHSLKAYHAKRDFTQTKEPPAQKAKTKGHLPLFVIQKHAASRLHFDFRLEMNGVLKSWAVPKGPPYTRAERRLAMWVEDHPLSYARFEGTIAPGNYGAGTVMVWDIGTYEIIDGNFHSGKLHLILHGKKLQGEWIIVRGRKTEDEEKTPWFLIKGGENMTAPKNEDRSVLTHRTMEEIAEANDSQWPSNRRARGSSRKSLASRN